MQGRHGRIDAAALVPGRPVSRTSGMGMDNWRQDGKLEEGVLFEKFEIIPHTGLTMDDHGLYWVRRGGIRRPLRLPRRRRREKDPEKPTGEVCPLTRARNQAREPRRRETPARARAQARAIRAEKGSATARPAAGEQNEVDTEGRTGTCRRCNVWRLEWIAGVPARKGSFMPERAIGYVPRACRS